MSAAVKLSDKLVINAKRYGNLYNRSIPKQIEHWSQIGKLAEENPDLPYSFIRDILYAINEVQFGDTEEYKFDTEK